VFDEEDGTLDGIAAGTVSCTVVQKPFQFGYLSSKMLNRPGDQGQVCGAESAGRRYRRPL